MLAEIAMIIVHTLSAGMVLMPFRDYRVKGGFYGKDKNVGLVEDKVANWLGKGIGKGANMVNSRAERGLLESEKNQLQPLADEGN